MSIQVWLNLGLAFDKLNVKVKYTDLDATSSSKILCKEHHP
jgi:hypothetical protein